MMKVFALLMALQQEPQGDACGFDPETIREEGVAAEEKQGQEEGAQEELPLKVEPVVGAEWESQWFPKEVLYRNYMADPLTPRSGSKLMFPFRKEDNIKIENCLGTQRTVWRRLDPDGREGLDVGIEGAVISRFDLNEDWDMDSADYRFGLPIGYRKGNVAVKIHAWHLTSHLGDELITRTGARALRYNKEELAFGFACDITPEVRLYADGGWGFHLDGPKERWRFQLGGEWVREHLWEGAPRTFVACDLKWREDTGDWAISMQGGFWMIQSSAAATAGMRILLEYYRGTAAQTQFPDERDHYWALGFAAGF